MRTVSPLFPAIIVAALGDTINHVLLLSSKEEVVGPHAKSIIAPVEDFLSFRDLSDIEPVGPSVSQAKPRESPIGVGGMLFLASFPSPTSSRSFNSR